ncbi:hypothetical protein PIB30_072393 [Stylosanthes scabra]|uniref:Uncharacterized protein n=1 Tax=Stylosanthes scabra TaxID=79078 RepID=A0ABU6WNY8_9FABA|nr:hypothetical protein [Stylosanthes scabra]
MPREDLDLALDVGDKVALGDLLLVDDLDCDAVTGVDIASGANLDEGSMAYKRRLWVVGGSGRMVLKA